MKAEKLGRLMRELLVSLGSPLITIVRGRGLLNAIVIDDTKLTGGKSAWDICLLMKKHGVLAKPTHCNIIRLAPPLVITEEEVREGVRRIAQALVDILVIPREEIEGWDQ